MAAFREQPQHHTPVLTIRLTAPHIAGAHPPVARTRYGTIPPQTLSGKQQYPIHPLNHRVPALWP